MNLLDLVPAFKRHLGRYQRSSDTDSTLAAYLADGIEALAWRWDRDYEIEVTHPSTYNVEPLVETKDKRPIVLMAAIIYKMSAVDLASFRDGDFAYDPQQGRQNPIASDIAELDKLLPAGVHNLASAIAAPLRGYSGYFNPESYNYPGWIHAVRIRNNSV